MYEGKHFVSARASIACPYYIGDDCKRTIRCEGPMDGAKLDLVFDSKPQMQFHLDGLDAVLIQQLAMLFGKRPVTVSVTVTAK